MKQKNQISFLQKKLNEPFRGVKNMEPSVSWNDLEKVFQESDELKIKTQVLSGKKKNMEMGLLSNVENMVHNEKNE